MNTLDFPQRVCDARFLCEGNPKLQLQRYTDQRLPPHDVSLRLGCRRSSPGHDKIWQTDFIPAGKI